MTREEAIKRIEDIKRNYERMVEIITDNEAEALNMAIEALKVIDELVRCKDCVYSKPWYKDKSLCYLWSETGIDVFNDGYCSYGKSEKKEGDA